VERPTDHLALFLDVPRPGTLRPELTREVGDQQALRLYRLLVSRVLDLARALELPRTVWYTPAEAGPEMRRWLGSEESLRPQASGEFGARLATASRAVEPGTRWLAVWGDQPGLTAEILVEARDLLRAYPSVIGPTSQGGIYLFGGLSPIAEPDPPLPWGTPRLLQVIRDGFRARGIPFAEVSMLRALVNGADARAAGLLT
jgi:glycosyltransferase A (GT-A) superfamily protein (DUF2064 family)